MKVHEKSAVFRQGEVMPFSWTEVGFMMDCPEGITLRFNLTSEKKKFAIMISLISKMIERLFTNLAQYRL